MEERAEQILRGEPMEFNVFGRRIAAKHWGSSSGVRTLALHGWLDNANTFNWLAPLLPELNIVALDFAGHGLSDHRAAGVHYHNLMDIQDILMVAEQLEWSKFGLIGHSMGASIASELSALFPERINEAVMIDGFVTTGGACPEEQLEHNREAVQSMLTAHLKQPRVYADVSVMAQRVTEATDQSLAAAQILVQRGHKSVDQGVTWRTDPCIRFTTPLRYTREQINLMLQSTSAPGLLIVAEQGDTWYHGEIEETQAHHPSLQVVKMPGPHHIHLEAETVKAVAGHIRDFHKLPPIPLNDAEALEWDGLR